MQTFQASSSADRVAGESIRAALEALGIWRAKGERIMAEHGLPEPRPGEWYPFQAYLDALRHMYEKIGPATIVDIGKKLVANNKFPPGIDTLEQALATLDAAYRARHRGSELGFFRFEKLDDRRLRMTIRNPYPCELDRGVVQALAQRFRPPRAVGLRVAHPDEQHCRKHGADECVLEVTW
jgi:hypothetical protein